MSRTHRPLALIALLTLLFSSLAALPAHAATTGGISGRVTGPAGQPLPGIEVSALAWSVEDGSADWFDVETATTDANGVYALTNLAPGTYRVEFDDPSETFEFTYFGGADEVEDARDLVVAAGQTIPGVDASLALFTDDDDEDDFDDDEIRTVGSISITTPRLSAKKKVYGTTGSVTVRVRVGGAKRGTVAFASGSTKLGSAKLSKRWAKLTLPDDLKAGRYPRITATLTGAGQDQPIASFAGPALTVSKASPGPVTLKRTAKKGAKPTLSIKVGKLNNGRWPTGTVKLSYGKTRQKAVLKKRNRGKVEVTLKKAPTATVKVKASFVPADKNSVESRNAKALTLRVQRG